jgi:hypothetical protein
MKDYSIADLAQIRNDFSLDGGTEDTEKMVSEMGGESFGSVTPAEDLVVSNPLTVQVAASDLEFTKSQGFHGIIQIIDDRIEHFTKKAENVKLSRDERSAFQDKALGAREVKLAIAEFVAERRLRLQSATTEERASMGAGAKAKIARLTADSPFASVPDVLSDAPTGWADDVAAPLPEKVNNRDEPELKPVRIDGVNFIARKN